MKMIRILGFAAWTLVLGLLGLFFFDKYEQRQEIRRLREHVARLTAEERRARIFVDAIVADPSAGTEIVHLRWLETDGKGNPLPDAEVRKLQVLGRDVYFDAHQIIFETDHLLEGDPLRGKALTLFARAYGDDQKPREGVPLDVPPGILTHDARGASPPPPPIPPRFRAGSGAPSHLELRLWQDFWDLMEDAERARREGVRTAQGTAVHKRLVQGKEYRLVQTAPGQILLEGPFEPDPLFMSPAR